MPLTADSASHLRGIGLFFLNRRPKHPKLDRLRHVDLRSLNYLISDTFRRSEVRRPRSYTWRVNVHLDQGSEGACVGFGCAHEIAARPVVLAVTEQLARDIYHEAQTIDPWPGENYEGTSVLAGLQVLQRRGYISEYRWALDVDELAVAVGFKGPAIIGVDWYDGMWSPDPDGFLRPTGHIVGGHCVLIYGVRIVRAADGSIDYTRSFFKIWNSWGPSWGHNGTAKISFIDMAILFPGGDFAIPIKRLRPKE